MSTRTSASAALAAVLALGVAAPVHADPSNVQPLRRDPDTVFLRLVSQIRGVIIVDPAITERGGRGVCSYIASGKNRDDAKAQILVEVPSLTPDEAAQVVSDAMTAYCPWRDHDWHVA